jgi:hypothetical protein
MSVRKNCERPKKYFIGIEFAHNLDRKSFNLYRCMKKKGIRLRPGSPAEMMFLYRQCCIKKGIHSVTLIPYLEGLVYLAEWHCRRRHMSAKKYIFN